MASIDGRKWDVFLSFRGDTRFKFADHLYRDLKRKGIRTFRDDEGLDRGGEIASSLLKAIEESRLSVIIFSENYAHSRWCLDEVVKIMESREEKGQIVVPVFYHVDPSDVRKQRGSFGEAFTKYGNVSGEKLLKWKAALSKAGYLSGWHVKHGYEGTYIEEIVMDIIKRLKLKLLHVPENLVGMDSCLEEMASHICMDSNNVRMIGVHGIGGIGKTTIAKVVYNKIADQFEGFSFLSDVRTVSGDQGLLHLQKQLLENIIREKNPSPSNIHEGIIMIKSILHSRKVLLVLDDVDDQTQLKSLAGNHEWFGSGSRILITTRNKHLLEAHGVDGMYEAKELNYEEAIQLFSQNAFKQNLPPEDYIKLSICAVNYASGLPLALELLGSSLFGKTTKEWTCELHKLEREPNVKIQNVLRISFDGLSHMQKEIFLHIACFFKGEDKNFVTRILKSFDLPATSGIGVLHDRSLIHTLENRLLMHDLIQQMGQDIVREECHKEPGRRSRLWDHEDVHHVLTKNTGTELIEGIQLDMSRSGETHVKSKAFAMMHGLRYLKVYWGFEGNCNNGNCKLHLPSNLQFPSHELRYLHWDRYPLESLPLNFHAESLVEFNMCYGHIKELWKEHKDLKKLEVINLSHSQHLIACPDLSGAPNLKRLILDDCTNLLEVHPSVGKLKNLTILNLENCSRLRYFPRITGLESLKVLNLSGCSELEKFPEIQGNMDCLSELNLKSSAISELPSSVGHLPGLVLLDMQDCKNLKILPKSICALKSLETLLFSGCSKLERFPEIRVAMEHLKDLLLDRTLIKELPSSIVHLKVLRLLNLRKCKNLRSLPNSICDLKSLETLIVSGCAKLSKLPEDLGSLQSLVNLHADGTSITQPPRSIVHLRNLKELSFSGCKESTASFWGSPFLFKLLHRENLDWMGFQLPSLSGLFSLKDLDLSGCNLIEGAIDNKLCCLHSLEVLNLSKNNFVKIPAEINALSNLTVLLVRQCQKLQKIAKLPPSIKLLDACDCTSLKSLSTPSPVRPLQMSLECSSSSSLLRPVMFKLPNCSGLVQDHVAVIKQLHQNLFPDIEYSIVVPGSRIPKWFLYQNVESSATVELPPNWLDNFMGFALCAVFALEEDEIIQGPGQICCHFEFTEGPHFSSSISWQHSGSSIVDTDHIWLTYQPEAQFMKSMFRSAEKFRHLTAFFSLYGASYVVKRCGIHLIYTGDDVMRSRL